MSRPDDLTRRHRPWILDLPPYVPGAAASGGDAGKLSSNELPVSPPPEVRAAIDTAAQRLNRYPEPLADSLRVHLASRYGMDRDQFLVGNGSDELIQLLAHLHLGQQARVAVPDPPYLMHEIACRSEGADMTRVRLDRYRVDPRALSEVDAEAIFLANPHNCTGTTIQRADIEALLARSNAALIVIDEAYIDFADDPESLTALPLIEDGRVVVLRTFSKMAGLAGARIGYLAAAHDIVARLRRVRAPFSVNAPSQAAASAILDQPEWLAHQREAVRAGLERMRDIFQNAGFTVVPTQTNFLLVATREETATVERLAGAGLSVRPGGALGIPGHIRISVGCDETITRLETALSEPK